MATYETSRSGLRAPVDATGWSREKICHTAIIAMTTAMIDNANDDVGLFYVPAGFIVTDIAVNATDMDSGTALLIDIGDSADEDRLLAASNIGQAGGTTTSLATTGFLYKYTARTQVRAYINTAAGTAVAGTLKVVLTGFNDPEYSTTALVAS